jgi:hypothetical protein
MNCTSQTLRTLSETSRNLLIQQEISSVLDRVICDIEIAHDLETKINQEMLIAQLRSRCSRAEKALDEYKVMDKAKENKKHHMGVQLLKDLFELDKRLAEQETQQIAIEDTAEDMPNHDSDVESGGSKEDNCSSIARENLDGRTDDLPRENISSNDSVPIANELSAPDRSSGPDGEVERVNVHQPSDETTTLDSKTNRGQVQQNNMSSSVKPFSAEVPSLLSISGPLLMSVFEFMDALDIVNMAQTNVRLYSKVDSIFGLGGTIVAGSRSTDENEYGEVSEADAAVVVVDDDNDDEGGEEETVKIAESSNDFNETSSVVESPESTHQTSATIVSIPKPNSSISEAPQKSSSTEGTERSTRNVNSHIEGDMIQSTSALSSNEPEVKVKIPIQKKKSTSTAIYSISPAVAQSLAMKLSPAELSAIIAMRDQLRKKGEEVIAMEQDFDDITAQLEGTISVKEILTEKVGQLQNTLKCDREISAKITRQTASDQEVIAFLDERVQELERTVENLNADQATAGKSVEKIKLASERQVAVLSDMLAYEREQKVDQEKEWRSTKKLLVKEVKHCRAQIMTLEAERDGFRQENDRLKEAMLSFGSMAGAKNRSFDN